MEFKQQGKLVKIQGDPKLLRTKVSLQSICKHTDVELAMFLWVLDTADTQETVDTADTQETVQYGGSIVERKTSARGTGWIS